VRFFARRDAPPAEVLAAFEPGERVLSWAETAAGAAVVATPRGLWWPGPDGPRLIGWQSVTTAVWRDGVLSVVEADLVDDLLLVDRAAVAAELTTPRDLPPTVRRRVEGNIVYSDRAGFPGGVARLVARRVPGQDGVRWWARLQDGTLDSDQVRSAVQARLAILRSEWDEQQR
jgi:hypothetical protein